MKTIPIHEAKTHFSKLIQKALSGEEIIISKGKKPVVKIVPIPGAQEDRKPGGGTGILQWISPDFDEPLEEFDDFMK